MISGYDCWKRKGLSRRRKLENVGAETTVCLLFVCILCILFIIIIIIIIIIEQLCECVGHTAVKVT